MDSTVELPVLAKTISREEINALPLFRYEGPVHLIRDDHEAEKALAHLNTTTVLGFDTESRPTFRKGQNYPASLLQLACAEAVYLFQLQRLKHLQPIMGLLANGAVIKAGVAIRDDIRKLQDQCLFEPEGFVEIADLTQKADIVNTGLRSLAAIFLGVRISKGSQISNWGRSRLTSAQISYAATDAWISRRLYERIHELGLA